MIRFRDAEIRVSTTKFGTKRIPKGIILLFVAAAILMYNNLRSSLWRKHMLHEIKLSVGMVTKPASCFPPWKGKQVSFPSSLTLNETLNSIVYIEVAFFNLHSETFYALINYFCSCDSEKNHLWVLKNDNFPIFCVGPEGFVRPDLRRILEEFNNTTCGPILIGTPPEQSIDITLHTTSYESKLYRNENRGGYSELVNDPKHIFICHDDAPKYENASNVFFLTPLHSKYIVPSYFPPTIVQRSTRQLREHPNPVPVFVVLGDYTDPRKRNTNSLGAALVSQREKNFTIHFLGGGSDSGQNETHFERLEGHHTVRFTLNSGADIFMNNVANADVILPLVDETIFYIKKGYQSGKKLTSAISWGLGFRKRMVVYRALADVFGIRERPGLYCIYDNSTHFKRVFGQCLDYLLHEKKEQFRSRQDRQ